MIMTEKEAKYSTDRQKVFVGGLTERKKERGNREAVIQSVRFQDSKSTYCISNLHFLFVEFQFLWKRERKQSKRKTAAATLLLLLLLTVGIS